MTRTNLASLVGWVSALAVVGVLGRPVLGQAIEKKAAPAVAVGEKAQAAPKKRSGHQLPPYYGGVIDESQRAKIYAIQDEFNPKITALKDQLDALTTQRNEKVAAVLTADQRAKVEAKKTEAKARRSAKTDSPKPAEGKNAGNTARAAAK
jgi:cell division protein ZapA (FtsZ GTPase activity inhibitor)